MITHSVEDAVVTLRRGDLVAIPTETVYGLAADASSQLAVERIYEVKGRPLNHPVIVHISSAAEIGRWAVDVPSWAYLLAETFWPGPLTLILPRAKGVGDWITGGQESVGLRVPNHPVALEIIRKSGLGLAGRDLIFDGGDCAVGLESTIVDATSAQPSILRLGAVTAAQVEEVTGLALIQGKSDIRAAGTLETHYSPRAIVHLDLVEGADGFIALSEIATPNGLIRLFAPANISEYAQGLYEALRRADALGLHDVVALAPEGVGLAAAIRDRLKRAAASH
jgi:L-threonylcarbamoyladenylate synthase